MDEFNPMMHTFIPGEISNDSKESLIASLRGALEQFQDLVERMPVCLLVHRAGRIVYVNSGFLQLMGYEKAEEMVGRSIIEIISPEDHHRVYERLKNNETRTETFYNPLVEGWGIRKNGEKICAEVESVATVFQGIPSVVVIVRDITARKKSEEALKRSDENFINIIREMPLGILIMDEDRVLFNNKSFAQMMGYDSSSNFLGCRTLDFVHPDYHAVSRERVLGILNKGGSNSRIKFKLLGKDAKTVDVESSCMAVEFDGKKAVMAVIDDITIQNQMEYQSILNDKLATVGTLAAGIAHEVNNPLTFVLGNLSFLKEQVEQMKAGIEKKTFLEPEFKTTLSDMSEEISDITRGGERIRDIVRGLKAFVRTSDDKAERVDLNQMIESALNMTFHVFKQKARLEKDLAINLPLLMIHPGKIQQVFINLIINAAQAIEGNHPGKNKIHIRTGKENNCLFVEFRDTGSGIPANILPRIFDPFFTTKPVGVGTGLGLPVCNEILRHYQGSLEVDSHVGEGTTFTVRLPLEQGHSEPAAETQSQAVSHMTKVLVVDDEPDNLEVICRMLKKKHNVLRALTAMEAMTILEEQYGQIESVVTDVNMPDMNGIDFYKSAAAKFPGFEKKFVFITGGIFSEETKNFLRHIPNQCLEKPLNFEMLFKAVSPSKDELFE